MRLTPVFRTKTKKYKNFSTVSGRPAFTLVETLVFLFIFVLVTVTFYRVYSAGIRYILDSKNRLGALSVANEKMEIVRNLKYDSIGTVNGAVSGSIQDEEYLTENAKQYHVSTLVEYIDDPLDGAGLADEIWYTDYKRVTTTVHWNNGVGGQESVKLVSRFVPPGLEVKNAGDGILAINVFSNQPGGTGIPDSAVHVVNGDTGLDTTVRTDDSGSVTLMGDKITNSIQKYQIFLSKSDYETVNTMPPYPETSAYNPVDVHASVVTGSMNVFNIVQNKLASFKVNTVDYLNNPVADINFHINGGRIIGNTIATETEPSRPVYNLDTDSKTDSEGKKDFGRISPGQYAFALSPSVTDYTLIDTDPAYPFSLFSEQEVALKVKLAGNAATSLLVKVVRDEGGGSLAPVPGAQVELKKGTDYDVTQATSGMGAAFFPVTADEFQAGDYDLKITAGDFADNNSRVTIDAGQLKIKTITLTAL